MTVTRFYPCLFSRPLFCAAYTCFLGHTIIEQKQPFLKQPNLRSAKSFIRLVSEYSRLLSLRASKDVLHQYEMFDQRHLSRKTPLAARGAKRTASFAGYIRLDGI